MESSKFCSNIFFEILSRTSLKTLDQCKSVCKEWNDLTYESSFTTLHCKRTNTISGYFVQNPIPIGFVNEFASMDKSNQISLDFLPRWMKNHTRIFASSRSGILCCLSEEHKNNRLYVCKPSTQQWRVLPNPKMRYFTEKVAMVVIGSDPLRYKIVRLSRTKRWFINNSFHCEIFDSKTWKWKKLDDILIPNETFFDRQSAVVVGGSIFWLLTKDFILHFNITTENYKILSIPKYLEEETSYLITKELIEYKGKLAFLSQAEHLIIWVLEDYENYAWGLIKKLSLKAIREKDRHASCKGFYDADVAVMAGFSSVIFYNFKNSSMRKIKTGFNFSELHDLFWFRSDSEPIELSGRC